jgi:hypothetical protein
MNKLIFNPLSGKFDFVGAATIFEVAAVEVTTPNAWTNVPLNQITTVGSVEIYDQTNKESVIVDSRVNGSTVEIRSRQTKIYSIRVEGY